MKKSQTFFYTIFTFLFLTCSALANKSEAPDRPKGFTFSTKSKKSNLNISLFGQGSIQHDWIDSGQKFLRTHISTARVILSGQAARPEATYYSSFDFAGVNGNGTPTFMDVYVNYQFSPKFDVTVGYFKVPFSLLALVHDPEQIFTGESTAHANFNPGRDVGIDLGGEGIAGMIDYNVYVFNGSGTSFTAANTEQNLEPIVGSRVRVHLIGDHTGYEQIDWRNSNFTYTFGFATIYDPKSTHSMNTLGNHKTIRFTLDETLRWHRFTWMGAYHYLHNFTSKDSTNALESVASYLFLPGWVFAIRGSINAPRKAGAFGAGPNNIYEIGGAVVHFFFGRNLKVTLDYKAKIRKSSGTRLIDHFVRTQTQVWL